MDWIFDVLAWPIGLAGLTAIAWLFGSIGLWIFGDPPEESEEDQMDNAAW